MTGGTARAHPHRQLLILVLEKSRSRYVSQRLTFARNNVTYTDVHNPMYVCMYVYGFRANRFFFFFYTTLYNESGTAHGVHTVS